MGPQYWKSQTFNGSRRKIFEFFTSLYRCSKDMVSAITILSYVPTLWGEGLWNRLGKSQSTDTILTPDGEDVLPIESKLLQVNYSY